MRLAATVLTVLALSAPHAMAQSTSDRQVREALIGSWAPAPALCATAALRFGPDGSVSRGGQPAGSFEIRDGALVARRDGQTDVAPLRVQGDRLMLRSQGRSDITHLVRCPETRAGGRGLETFIVGTWATSSSECSRGGLRLNADGSADVIGQPQQKGRYVLRGDTLTLTIGNETQTGRVERDGDGLVTVEPNGRRTRFTRCAASGTDSAFGSTRDAILQRQLLGSWAVSPGMCAASAMVFHEDGSLTTPGRVPNGSFSVRDGILSIQVGGRTETARLSFPDGAMRLDRTDGVPATFTRCDGIGGGVTAPSSRILVAVKALVDRAFDEQRIFLTCSATMSEQFEQASRLWAEDVARAASLLSRLPQTAAYATEFREAARPERLVPLDQPYSRVLETCRRAGDWPRRLQRRDYVVLSERLPAVLEGR